MKSDYFPLSVHFAMMALVVILLLLIVRFEPHTFLWGGVYGVMLAVGLDHFHDAVREMILSLMSGGEPREFAADRYLDFRDNLYAVAKTLEALRGIDRWGLSSRGKQYKGFAPLLPPPSAASVLSDRAEALRFLSGASGIFLGVNPESAAMKRAYDNAAKRLHPDTGGDHDQFIRLQQAYELLRRRPDA